ncbi:MAG: type IV pili methyl-accepting chemotaxis transducer N-terminal domain-containing protein [Chloroflexi bacterium]|nr:type IV pili methyl-accepting chemotaxis transducer N-terminal domain-containing protein [Chloroflexota bacterium]MBI3340640.1 type IV pili methyl-accepting chemotaxis transducer N-terminal domain-containing protein [Chloroflexota bacterium]
MIHRLQVQLTILFTAFVLLVLVSVGVTYLGLQTQQQDALVINLAGRQRMLIQQMTRLSFQLQDGDESASVTLKESEQTFSQTLSALRNGGSAPYLTNSVVNLPITRDPQLLAALDEVGSSWNQYRSTLDAMDTSADSVSLLITLEKQSDNLVQEADAVVRLYEVTSTAKVNRLRFIQIVFLVFAIMLLAVGAWMTRRSLLKPLDDLGLAAKRLGENQLDAPIQVEGPEEMRTLSQAFDEMRSRLHTARGELIQWNAALEQRVAQRTHELETLNEVSREISSRLDIQQVLNSVTEKARTLLGGEVASLCLVDESQHWLKLQTLSGPKHAVVGNTMRADNQFANAVLESDGAMICGVDACRGGCRMLSDEYRVSHLAAPLRIGDRTIGALCVGSPAQNQFAAESADMLTKLANVAVIALENARLFAQAERVATLEERRRVAAEMHDGLGQTLSYLGLMTDQVVEFLSDGKEVSALQRLHKTRETISKATSDVRRAINSLMDETPATKDLCTRLRDTLDEVASQHDLESVWRSDADAAPDCSPQTAEQVYNITREALTNAARHANAKQVSVQVGRSNENYFVTVEDDGNGFDITQPAPGGHFGLQIMQARAKHIGGEIEVQSTPGSGTRITLMWPIEERE